MNFFVLDARNVVVATMTSNMEQPDALLIDDDELFADGQARTGRCRYVGGALVDHEPPPEPVAVPDGPTLSDWRVGMTLWGRLDDVTARVSALIASDKAAEVMAGKVARERLEYANHVERSQLVQLGPLFGFGETEIDESLWRADRVRQGDLSGVWPLPQDG